MRQTKIPALTGAHTLMDGSVGEWMGGWMDGWVDGLDVWMDAWISGWCVTALAQPKLVNSYSVPGKGKEWKGQWGVIISMHS